MSTWDRVPTITEELQQGIFRCIHAKCSELKCILIEIGGVEDHMHVLVCFPTTISIAELVKEIKGSSSHLTTHVLSGGDGFKWQGGYGAFTVSKADVERIRRYIRNQREHHRMNELDMELESTEGG